MISGMCRSAVDRIEQPVLCAVSEDAWMNTVACRHQWLLGCAVGCLLGLAGCGGSSPEKVFQTWSAAVQAGNFPATWECLTPQARGTVLQIMVLDSDLLSAANPAAKQAFGTVFAKYGLNPQDAGFAQTRLQVTNAAEYALELNNVLRQYQNDLAKLEGSRFQKLNAIWKASSQASLAPSQKQGTRATAAVQGAIPHTAANAQVQAVFEKVNGQWLFAELEENTGAGAMAGGPGGAGANAPGMKPAGPAGQGASPTGNMPAGPPGAQAAMPPGPPGGDNKAMPGSMNAAAGQPPGMPVGGGPMPTNPAAGANAQAPADPKNMPALAGGPNMREGGLGFPGGEKAMPAGPGGPAALGAEAAKAMPANPGAVGGKAKEGDEKAMPARPGVPGPGGLMLGKDGDGDPKKMPAADANKNMAANAAGAGAAIGPNAAEAGGAERAGLAGAGAGGGAYGNQNRPKQGTWEYAVVTFMEKVAEGDYSGMEYLVTSKAKGLLKEIRDDEVRAEKKDELKAAFAEASFVEGSAKNTGAARNLSMKGKLGHVIQLSVSKENGEFRIRELKINEPGATKKR